MNRILRCIVFIVLAAAFVSCSKNTRTLYVHTWAEYLCPEVIADFEKKYNCEVKVVLDYFDSNEAMYAKLKITGGGEYDIVIPSGYMASLMKRNDFIDDIDKSQIPNLKNIEMQYLQKMNDPDMKYSVPYGIGFCVLGYNKSKIPDLKPTWQNFGNPQFFHKITMLKDMRESIGVALICLGYSINTTDDRQLQEAKELLLKWKKNIAAYQYDEARTSLAFNNLSVIHAWNIDMLLMEKGNPEFAFVIPEEGTLIGYDSFVIPKNAKNKDLAYEFINFMYVPENAVRNMKHTPFLAPNREALKLLDKEFLKKITIPDNISEKSEFIKDIGYDIGKYQKIWMDILSQS
ncbi:MAG: spermidine/putrescine ABC transporter substrate-binding protein [Lentisphaerota bacterium]